MGPALIIAVVAESSSSTSLSSRRSPTCGSPGLRRVRHPESPFVPSTSPASPYSCDCASRSRAELPSLDAVVIGAVRRDVQHNSLADLRQAALGLLSAWTMCQTRHLDFIDTTIQVG